MSESLTLAPPRPPSLRLAVAVPLSLSLLEPPPRLAQPVVAKAARKTGITRLRGFIIRGSLYGRLRGTRSDLASGRRTGSAARISHPYCLKPALHRRGDGG
ncbi:MAG: hypothetical protein IPL99_11025 [Candidatus Competibacteraceae bacterium]|nr:hypothetical protein [Candidatus Competibacteraceae bacterium]